MHLHGEAPFIAVETDVCFFHSNHLVHSFGQNIHLIRLGQEVPKMNSQVNRNGQTDLNVNVEYSMQSL